FLARRLAHHQLRSQHHLARRHGAFGLLQKQQRRRAPNLKRGVHHRGQHGLDHRGVVLVGKADQRHIGRNAQALPSYLLHGGEGGGAGRRADLPRRGLRGSRPSARG
nr:hypothetical protein [Tanacetum cinerariifolium]